jgi:hypothetical protein
VVDRWPNMGVECRCWYTRWGWAKSEVDATCGADGHAGAVCGTVGGHWCPTWRVRGSRHQYPLCSEAYPCKTLIEMGMSLWGVVAEVFG